MAVSDLIGLAGVSKQENARAQAWARRLEWPMLLLCLWIILEWYLAETGVITRGFAAITDWVLWGFFATEALILSSLVDRPLRYLRGNWVNLLIILLMFPPFIAAIPGAGGLRLLRLAVLFNLALQFSGRTRRMLMANHIGPVIVAALILVVVAGFIVAGIDPAVATPWEGIWWAWVTITTVGYGDIVPETSAGKIFATLLILVGIGLVSIMTATFSAFFVNEDRRRMETLLIRQDRSRQELEAQLDRIEAHLKGLEERLEQLQSPTDRAP